jgi:hypothetical protein
MSRYYPVLSECTLEDCGAYERFQVNHVQVWHRYLHSGNIIWIAVFKDLDGVDMEASNEIHYWYSKCLKSWYLNQRSIGDMRPSIEVWYQDYLKSRAVTTCPASEASTYST